MTPDTCRFCSCSNETPCAGGCAWTDETRTVCSQCQAAVDVAEKLIAVLGQVITRQMPKRRLALPTWADLELPEQQLLVMACRATVDAIQEALLEGMTVDAVSAGIELNALEGYLLERYPEELQTDEPTSAIVMRLLEPHVGARIVVP
jgi:hypothetical protein